VGPGKKETGKYVYKGEEIGMYVLGRWREMWVFEREREVCDYWREREVCHHHWRER